MRLLIALILAIPLCASAQSVPYPPDAPTIAEIRAALENAKIIDVDPNEPGTTTAGLHEATQHCGANACILQLRCNTTYPISASHDWATDPNAIEPASNTWIRGCGAGSVISMSDNTGEDEVHLIHFEDKENLVISDLKINQTETCTSTCDKTDHPSLINIVGSASKVIIENTVLYSTAAATTDASINGFRNIWVYADTGDTPDSVPRRVFIGPNNDIQGSARAVELQHCDHCGVWNNYINLFGYAADTTTPPSMALVIKYEGIGVSIIGNLLNFKLDGMAAGAFSNGIRGLWLIRDFGTTDAAGLNESVMVTGNTFEGMRATNLFGIQFSGYQAATIVGNHFRAGQCSTTSTRSCYVNDDCSDLAETCTFSGATAIKFTGDATDSNGSNQDNIIASNTFTGFNDTDTNAPIVFDTITGTDANENANNTIAVNHMRLQDSTDDGLGGDSSLYLNNRIFGNQVSGQYIPRERPIEDELIFCGDNVNNTTTYLGPAVTPFLGDTSGSWAMASVNCSTLDNTTEATADAPIASNWPAIIPHGLVCRLSSDPANNVVITLRSAAADLTPSLTCTVAGTGTATSCRTTQVPGAVVAAGATMAVRVVTTEDLSAQDVWCKLSFSTQ